MLINLTPHPLTIQRADGSFVTLPPAEIPAHCEIFSTIVGEIEGITISRIDFGPVTGLPPESTLLTRIMGEEPHTYIVNKFVKSACPDRIDLLSYGSRVQDSKGRLVGCKGLTR